MGTVVRSVTIPYALHQSAPGENPVPTDTRPDGTLYDGRSRPDFDTLIAVANDSGDWADVTLSVRPGNGWASTWQHTYRLQPQRSFAMTFIPDNPFPDTPTDWWGSAEVEIVTPIPPETMPLHVLFPVEAFLGGGGWLPEHWNSFGAHVPIVDFSTRPLSRKVWRSAYAIPKYEDVNHAGGLAYRTGIAIHNHSSEDVGCWLDFTVADFYPDAGTKVSSGLFTVPAGGVWRNDVLSAIPGLGTFGNLEGWLRLRSDKQAHLTPFSLVVNQDHKHFAAGRPWL